MPFELPNLPYAHDALAPHMSKETLEYHHDKHHLAYVNNGNNLLKGTEWENKSLEEIVKGSFGKNAGLFNNAGQHYNHLHFWKWMKPQRRRRQDSGRAQGQDRQRSRRRRQGQGRLHPGRRHAVRLRLVLDRGQGRQARHHQDRERREPAGAGRQADPRLRRLGALLLHRLPQPPAGLSQGVLGKPGELGLRRRDVPGAPASNSAAHCDTASGAARPRFAFRPWRKLRRWSTMPPTLAHQPLGSPSPLARPAGLRRCWRCVALIAALTFRDYGLGWDDYTHAQYGDLLLSLYALGLPRHARAVVRQSLSLRRRLRHGGGAARQGPAVRSVRDAAARSAPRSALIGLAVTWRIGRRIGGPLAGLLALVLLATCPLYYGHMFINPKDAPFAVAMAIFLLGLVRLLEQYPKPCRDHAAHRRPWLRPCRSARASWRASA